MIKGRVIKGRRYKAWNINLPALACSEWVEKNPLTWKLSQVPPAVFSIWTCFDTAATGIYTADETLTGGPRRQPKSQLKLERICLPVAQRKTKEKVKLSLYKVKASKTNSLKGWKGVQGYWTRIRLFFDFKGHFDSGYVSADVVSFLFFYAGCARGLWWSK